MCFIFVWKIRFFFISGDSWSSVDCSHIHCHMRKPRGFLPCFVGWNVLCFHYWPNLLSFLFFLLCRLFLLFCVGLNIHLFPFSFFFSTFSLSHSFLSFFFPLFFYFSLDVYVHYWSLFLGRILDFGLNILPKRGGASIIKPRHWKVWES